MNKVKNQQKIYENINIFFSRILELKDSGKIEQFFRFLKKVPNHAPFNNALIFIQNPDCKYYATASQWEKRFNRFIKKDARPMIILFPFGPVEFVYDIDNTEGEPITDEKILFWWRENGGTLDEKIIENTKQNLKIIDVKYKQSDGWDYFRENSLSAGGYASRRYTDDEFSIALHPQYSKNSIEAYGVLCHEIAHILLGHLGGVKLPVKKNEKLIEIAGDRSFVPKNIKEVEAELVAWIVFNRLGIEKNSESYIASWLDKQENIKEFSMSEVLKVAGKIQNMGRDKNVFKYKKNQREEGVGVENI